MWGWPVLKPGFDQVPCAAGTRVTPRVVSDDGPRLLSAYHPKGDTGRSAPHLVHFPAA